MKIKLHKFSIVGLTLTAVVMSGCAKTKWYDSKVECEKENPECYYRCGGTFELVPGSEVTKRQGGNIYTTGEIRCKKYYWADKPE